MECLRNAHIHSADGWWDALDPVIARYTDRIKAGRFFRADAAYEIPANYERLEGEGYFYTIRMKKNAVIECCLTNRLTCPVAQPSKAKVKQFYEKFQYQARS